MTAQPSPTPEIAAGAQHRVKAPMLSLEAALQHLLEAAQPVCARQCETVSSFDALGRVLAADVGSLIDVPPLDNSAMDGIAVQAGAAGLDAGTVLPISQRVAAGQVGATLAPGSAARIFTGAPVPVGADAVLMQEECEFLPAPDADAASLGSVRLRAPVQSGQCVRRRGEDVAAGALVLSAGQRLDAAALGLAASVGAATLSVARRPRVALFSTGDELVLPGEPLRPGAIYNSNRHTLRALLQGLGCVVQDLGIVPDDLDATRAALREAARHNDLILTSGGVSVGEEDHVKPAVQAEGRLDLWQIAIKPGKPLAFGAVRREPGQGEAWFLGLPGNPVSSFVTFLVMVRPFILKLQGAAQLAPRAYRMPAGFAWNRIDRRREFIRVRVGDDGRLLPYFNQGSGVLTSMAWADGLVDIPPGHTFGEGDLVTFWSMRELA